MQNIPEDPENMIEEIKTSNEYKSNNNSKSAQRLKAHNDNKGEDSFEEQSKVQ